MALVAELITDRALGEPPWIRGDARGEEGQRQWRVNTHEEEIAYDTAPAIGDPWSTGRPNLTLRRKTTRYIGGKDGANGEGGTSIVIGEYATPSGGGFLPPPNIATKYTLIGCANETQTLYREVGVNPSNIPIANGEGVGVIVGMTTAKIYTYAQITAPFNFARLIRLQNKKNLNKDPITTPPVLGSAQGISVAALQMRFEGFTHNLVNGLREIVYDVSIADSFLYQWFTDGADGLLQGQVDSRIYAPDDLSGLW